MKRMLRIKPTTRLALVAAAATALLISSGGTSASAATPSSTGSVHPLTSYYDSTEYKNSNYGGSSLYITSPIPCADDVVLNKLTDGWGNSISSYQIGNGCTENHYQGDNQVGANTGYQSGAIAYIGDAMNDKTNSLQWK